MSMGLVINHLLYHSLCISEKITVDTFFLEKRKSIHKVQFMYIACDNCQNPIPGQTWELTLFSRGNKKKKKNNKHHPNSTRRGYPRDMKFCIRPSITKRIRWNP